MNQKKNVNSFYLSCATCEQLDQISSLIRANFSGTKKPLNWGFVLSLTSSFSIMNAFKISLFSSFWLFRSSPRHVHDYNPLSILYSLSPWFSFPNPLVFLAIDYPILISNSILLLQMCRISIIHYRRCDHIQTGMLYCTLSIQTQEDPIHCYYFSRRIVNRIGRCPRCRYQRLGTRFFCLAWTMGG
jgi:hypothetical protein